MRNYVHAGDVMPLTAPYAVATGGGFLVGSLFAVAAAAAGSGAAVQGHTRGVFILTALSTDTGSECARVFWDDTNRRCTVSASGNPLALPRVVDERHRRPGDQVALQVAPTTTSTTRSKPSPVSPAATGPAPTPTANPS